MAVCCNSYPHNKRKQRKKGKETMAIVIFVPKGHKVTAKEKHMLKSTFGKANKEIVEEWDGTTILKKYDLVISNVLPPYRLLDVHTVLNIYSALKLKNFIKIVGME